MEKRVKCTFDLDKDVFKWLKDKAKTERITMVGIIQKALKKEMEATKTK
jgi:hypothetical protein